MSAILSEQVRPVRQCAARDIRLPALTIPIDIKRQYHNDEMDYVVAVTFDSVQEQRKSGDNLFFGDIMIVYIEFADGSFDEWELLAIPFDNYWHEWMGWSRVDSGLAE